MGQGRKGPTLPTLSLGAATPMGTSQCSFLFGFSHHPPLRKKTREKFHHPFQDTPPNKYGKMGYSTLGSGNREEKKRLVWSSASWSGSPWPPRCHPLLVGLRAPAVPQRFSAASSRQPRLRWAQGGMGRKEEGLGTEVPTAPAPGAGRGGFMVLFACSSS